MHFFGTGIKTDVFQSCGHCWVFKICWHIECSTFTASSFRIWNNSAGFPSPALALFILMLLKAQLTSQSRMSGSRWVITLLRLSRSVRHFLHSSPGYSCYLFLVSSASVRSLLFLSFIMPILAWNVPLISPVFLKRSLVFPIVSFSLFLCIDYLRRPSHLSLLFSGILRSVGLCLSLFPCLSHLIFPQLFVKPLSQPLCLLAFVILRDGFGPCLLYNVMNLCQ